MSDTQETHCWDAVVGETERALAADYHRDRRPGPRPVLLLVDLYNRAFGDRPEPLAESRRRFPSSCGQGAWDALEPLARLLATARDRDIPVVHTTAESRPEARLGGATRRTACASDEDGWGTRIVAPLQPTDGELVVYKTAPSAFFATPLATHLRRLGTDTVVIGGETTSGCVRATAVDAHSHGFDVVVVEEATFDRSTLVHAMNLYDLHTKYATVAHLDGALAYLRQSTERDVPCELDSCSPAC